MRLHTKRGQVSIFVIVAFALVAVLAFVGIVWQFQKTEGGQGVSGEVFRYYEECIARETRDALRLAGTQGGHITTPEFVPGSDYAPFSSQLDFLGFPVPYWWYVSGNGVIKEQVPTQRTIEESLATYLAEAVKECDFSVFTERGISVTAEDAKVQVRLHDDAVLISLVANVRVDSSEGSAQRSKHDVEVASRFGALYRQALALYKYEKEHAFLENYSQDVLYLYAPVDGVETSCAPKVWKTREVVSKLQKALSENLATVKLQGDYYTLQDDTAKYFVVEQKVEDTVRFLYNPNWPSRIEIGGASQEIMATEPIGLQQGLGSIGFCYAPYHFVYDLSFPVLVQFVNEDELFQFPVVVVIDKNTPRRALYSELGAEKSSEDLCTFATETAEVSVSNALLQPIAGAEVSYACFEQRCSLGKTNSDGRVAGTLPGCMNGYLSASAVGYKTERQLFSSIQENKGSVILDRMYPLELEVRIAGQQTQGLTLVYFEGPEQTSVSYPDVRNVSLVEGMYNITVYAYGNASITIPASRSRECTSVPRSGFAGLFGQTREQCFDIQLPETKVDTALIGGGSTSLYLLPAELEKGKLTVTVPALSRPETLEQLQTNYEVFTKQKAEVVFK
jgi:hypothetical protein